MALCAYLSAVADATWGFSAGTEKKKEERGCEEIWGKVGGDEKEKRGKVHYY